MAVLVHGFSSVSTDGDKLLSGQSSWRCTIGISEKYSFLMVGWYSACPAALASRRLESSLTSSKSSKYCQPCSPLALWLRGTLPPSQLGVTWGGQVRSLLGQPFSGVLRRTLSVAMTGSWRRRAYADLWITSSSMSLVVTSSIQRRRKNGGSVGKRTS